MCVHGPRDFLVQIIALYSGARELLALTLTVVVINHPARPTIGP